MERDVPNLSRRLAPLQERLRARGFEEILIGGSAALGILDVVWHGAPLNLRDLDVYLIFGRKMERAEAVTLAQWLSVPEIGTLDAAGVTTHIRTNPKLPVPARFSYLAGWGMNFVKNDSILDLTVYHSIEEISLNGIFSSDTIKLRLAGTSLETLARDTIAEGSWEALRAAGVIKDDEGGYEAWRNKRPALLRWQEVERDPAVQSLRVVRSLQRYGLSHVPREIAEPFRRLAALKKPHDVSRWNSGLARLGEDGKEANALAMLRELGFSDLL